MENSKRMTAVIITLFLALSVGALACSSTQTTGEEITDASITAKVKAKLAADPDINPFNIDVDTLNHVVTLSGLVPEQEDIDQAVEIAMDTDGVNKVINNMQLAPRK